MRILLDIRDLIGLLDRSEPCSLAHCREVLIERDAVVVLTPTLAFELAAPLVHGSGQTVVSSRLNRLEELPLVYFANWRIPAMEIREAINAYAEQREHTNVDPVVPRLDVALDISGGRMRTTMYLHSPLAEIVLTVWQEAPDVFRRRTDLEQRLQALLSNDRRLEKPPLLSEHFRTKLGRDLHSYGIPEPSNLDRLADWIYANPNRCPGLRLTYEVYHQIRATRAFRCRDSSRSEGGSRSTGQHRARC